MQQVSIHQNFLKKVDLANLKSNVDKLDIDKLKNVLTNLNNLKSKVNKLDVDKLVPDPVDICKLSHVVKNDVVKKDIYNVKIKTIEDKISDITNSATNASLNAKIKEKGERWIEVKVEIPSITNLATTAALNAKINEITGELSNITDLATSTTLTAVENIILEVRNLVKKTDCNTKTSETENENTDYDHDKYITTPEFNKLTAENILQD